MDRSERLFVTAVTLAAVALGICLAVPISSPPASATTTWTLAQVPAPVGGWSAVDFLHGQWIAFSHAGVVAASSNGSSWTEQPVPVGSWQTAAYGSGNFVALSSANVIPNEMISTNGVQWSALAGPAGTPAQGGQPSLNGSWTGIAYGDGLFAAVSSLGTVATSPDGVTWTRQFWRPADDFTSITFGDGRFIAVDAAQGNILISLDGVHWSLIVQPLTGLVPAPPGGLHLGAVVYGKGNFVAMGDSPSGAGYVATSVYGYVWALHQYAPAQSINAITYGCGSFVAAGQSNAATETIINSTTGATWTPSTITTPTVANWTSVAYGARQYVAVDGAGDIATSQSAADCTAIVPTPPQQVSGNVHNGEVWTYMHPPPSAGGARVKGYRVAITDGVTTWYCRAKVYFEPNCIIKGLVNHQVYWVSTQAINRFGYSVPTDPEFVIPITRWRLAVTTAPIVKGSSTVLQVTGVIANPAGIYPTSSVSVHFGSQVLTCKPSPFGECVIPVANLSVGIDAVFATYTGYGHSYRSLTREVTVEST